MTSFSDYREEVRRAARLSEVLSARSVVAGRDHKAPCPFHADERHPNLQIYRDHVHCYACGAHADVFGLVERLDRVSHREAVDRLARDFGIAPWKSTPEEAERAKKADRCLLMLEVAAKFYATGLKDGHRTYLHQRGVSDEQIAAIGFGTANGRLAAHLRALSFSSDELCTPPEASRPLKWLAKTSDAGVTADFYWPDLLVIPIRVRGRVVGLTARNLKGEPKFVHLPGKRSPFGLDSLNDDEAVVVEGPFDSLAVNRHGYGAVALLGTGISDELATELRNLKKVYVALDADDAGKSSSADVASAIGPRARIVVLPEGKDPDEVSKDEFEAALKEARDVVGHKLKTINAALKPTEVVAQIEDLGLLDDLATEGELRSDAHIEEIARTLGFNKGETKQFRSTIKRRLREIQKTRAETETVRRQAAGQFHRFEDGRLADVVLSPGGRTTAWAIYDSTTDEVELAEKIPFENYDLIPQSGSEVLGWSSIDPFHPESGRAVLLHGPPLDYLDEATLFNEVRAFITKYFTEPDDNWLTLYVAYVFLSWAVEIASECPYLAWTGGPGSGKSRAMVTVGVLCRRPMILSAGSSAAALRRTVDRWRGTVIADEGLMNDKTDSGQAVLGIILAGFSRMTGVIQICEGDNNEPRAYFTYGPKLFTGQIDFKDPGARSRTLTRTLTGDNRRAGQPVQLPAEFERDAEAIRRKLQLWRFRTLARLGITESCEARPDGKEGALLEGVPSRIQQVFLPLLRVISDDEIRARLVKVARTHSADFVAAKRQRLESRILQAVADLIAPGGRTIRATVEGRIRTKAIRKRLLAVEQESGLEEQEARKTVPHPVGLGRMLNGTLGVRTDTDNKGSYVVLETEEDLRRVEAAMANFGVAVPWTRSNGEGREGSEGCAEGAEAALGHTTSVGSGIDSESKDRPCDSSTSFTTSTNPPVSSVSAEPNQPKALLDREGSEDEMELRQEREAIEREGSAA
jgi:DNA primase catalytic core